MHRSFMARSTGKSGPSAATTTRELALPERFRPRPRTTRIRKAEEDDDGDGEEEDSDEEEDDADDGIDGAGATDARGFMTAGAQSVYGMLAATQIGSSGRWAPPRRKGGQDGGMLEEGEEEDEDDDQVDNENFGAGTWKRGQDPRTASTSENKERDKAARLTQSLAVMPGRQRSSFEGWRTRKLGGAGGDSQGKSNKSAARSGIAGLQSVREGAEKIHKVEKDEDEMTQSQLLVRPREQHRTPSPTKEGATTEKHPAQGVPTTTADESAPTRPLPHVIADIFSFPEPEEVVAEYPCWYLQNVLLQGYMYITQRHVCFYAYLQKRPAGVEKAGHLGKQGRHSYSYRQYYFVLKGDSFSYYRDATDPYFPLGLVDLRYARAADVTTDPATGADTADFTITTADRVYQYRADDPATARVWVTAIRRARFRAQTAGDSVKIALPLTQVDDVERMPMIDFAETLRVRVIDDSEESAFAIDEYFFTFFGDAGPEAWDVLRRLVEDRRYSTATSGAVYPVDPGRSKAPAESKTRPNRLIDSSRESSDSLTTSSDHGQTSDDDDGDQDIAADMSASQVLTGDKVFGSPTLRIPASNRGARNARVPALQRTSTDKTVRPSVPDDDAQRRSSTDATALGRGKLAALSVANVVRSSGKRMGSYLSTSPTGYIGKFTEAVIGGTRHYDGAHVPAPADREVRADAASGAGAGEDTTTAADIAMRQQRFQEHFALPATEKLEATYFCYLHKNLPLYGKIYISTRRFCFRSLIYGVRTKLVIPFREIVNVEAQRGFRLGYAGIVLVINGHEELFFEFRTDGARNDCAGTVLRKLEASQEIAESMVLTDQQQRAAEGAAAENELLQAARRREHPEVTLPDLDDEFAPILADDPSAALVAPTPPPSPMLVTCLTIGSRGDVQPYIALCKGLQAAGHRARIATHAEFGPWVRSHGIEFAEVAGDPAELMRVCVENGMFTIPFFMEANSKFRSWLDGLLLTAWDACQGSDLVIESPSAMCGIHIAEALEVPYFRAFTMPWTRTRAYPHAFAVRNAKMGGAYNYMTYTLFDNVFWTWTEGQINRWRVNTLKLPPTNLDKLQQNKVPFLYNFSPSVVPPPLDFSDWVKVTGYWFLNEGTDYSPPEDLAAFIARARKDGQKLVYIGFGSVTVADSRKLTEQIVAAVQKADVRCILSKGWSDRFAAPSDGNAAPDPPLPDCIHTIRAAPHDWLFAQMDAAVHHGGAGTTGASLRAGIPTLIKPFFGDQYFFATRVADLGVGIHLRSATAQHLGKALWTATHDTRMQAKARALGEAIRSQDGVATAIRAIYADLDYARSLVKRRVAVGKNLRVPSSSGDEIEAKRVVAAGDATIDDTDESFDGGDGSAEGGFAIDPPLDEADARLEDTEENWTFVEKAAEELERSPTPSFPMQPVQQEAPRKGLSSKLRLGPMILGRRKVE